MPAGYDYYALIPLWIGNVLAFNPGQLVPDSTVVTQGWTVGYEVEAIGTPPPTIQTLISGPQTLSSDELAQIQENLNYVAAVDPSGDPIPGKKAQIIFDSTGFPVDIVQVDA